MPSNFGSASVVRYNCVNALGEYTALRTVMLRHTIVYEVSHLRHTTPNVLAEVICSCRIEEDLHGICAKLHVLEYAIQQKKNEKKERSNGINYVLD